MIAAPCLSISVTTTLCIHYKSRISNISETKFLNFEENRDFPDFKNFINFAIAICVVYMTIQHTRWLNELITLPVDHYNIGTFWLGTFWPTGTFCFKEGTFWLGTFWVWDVLTVGRFDSGTFWLDTIQTDSWVGAVGDQLCRRSEHEHRFAQVWLVIGQSAATGEWFRHCHNARSARVAAVTMMYVILCRASIM